MKITKTQLKRLIKEELQATLEETSLFGGTGGISDWFRGKMDKRPHQQEPEEAPEEPAAESGEEIDAQIGMDYAKYDRLAGSLFNKFKRDMSYGERESLAQGELYAGDQASRILDQHPSDWRPYEYGPQAEKHVERTLHKILKRKIDRYQSEVMASASRQR